MTDLKSWRGRRKRGEKHELPSGLHVQLRRVKLIDLVRQGKIPNDLLGLVDRVSREKLEFKISEIEGVLPMLEIVALACVAFPQIVANKPKEPEPEEEEDPLEKAKRENCLWVGELDADDLFDIFAWANSDAAEVRSFRHEQEVDVGAAQPGDDVQSAAVTDSGDS